MSTPHQSDDELAQAWHSLSVRYHKLQCDLDRELQACQQISNSEFEVLELLAAGDDSKMRMNELSGLVHLSQSALSRLVAGLEKDGLVERSMCADDRRSVFTELTIDGRARYAAAKPVQRAILRSEADCHSSGSLCGSTELERSATDGH